MKNPPTISEDLVRFRGAKDLVKIKNLPRYREFEKVVEKLPKGKDLLREVEDLTNA
jgi:hypothetical protein